MIRLAVERTPSFWIRLANWLGIRIYWTHSFIQYDGRMIEAGATGVVDTPFPPKRFFKSEFAFYELKPELFESEQAKREAYLKMLAFAKGEVGKRYKYEALPIILIRLLRLSFSKKRYLIGTGEVCTSLVDRTFLYAGFDLVKGETSPFVLPDELVESDLLMPVSLDFRS